MLDTLTTAVMCVDDGLKVQYLNTAAEQMLGVGSRKALKERLPRVINLPDALYDRLREAIETGQPYCDRQVAIEPNGMDPIQVDCHISPFETAPGNGGLLLELAAVDRRLRIARDEAMQAQQEHTRSLLRGLGHEIRNPLGGLRGAAQLLERQLEDAELHEYTSIIIREADRLQALIDRMLGPINLPRRDPLNIHEALEHVRAIVGVSAGPGIELQIDYDPSIPEFLNDRDRLVQVFLNIANNALQAIGEHGTILFRSRIISNHTVGGQRHPLMAAIEIRDDGPGVPPELFDQIFFPLVTGTDRGTGLGLSIAQSMMHQIGGLIECRSEPGKTIFTVLVPLEVS